VNVTAVLLAAGASSRLGEPKQLLKSKGLSLLRHAAVTACASRASEVIIVLGYEAPRMRSELAGLPVLVLENPLWREGISSSIRLAVSSLSADSEGVLLMVCDQPRLSSLHLNAPTGDQREFQRFSPAGFSRNSFFSEGTGVPKGCCTPMQRNSLRSSGPMAHLTWIPMRTFLRIFDFPAVFSTLKYFSFPTSAAS
jgi:hypothetical protein